MAFTPSWRMLKIPAIVLGAAVAVGLVVNVIVGLAGGSYTDAFKYGTVNVPDSQVLRLPAGSLDVTLRELTSESVSIPSQLAVSVVGVADRTPVPLKRDVGGDFGPQGGQATDIDYRRVWTIAIPTAGSYRVTTTGVTPDNGYAVEFGHAPLAIGAQIWEFTGLGALIVLVAILIGRTLAPRRSHPGAELQSG